MSDFFMVGIILCLAGAAACFAMFGANPVPDNQMTAVFGLFCVFCAFVCWRSRREE